MKFQIVTKTGVPIDQDAYEVILPTSGGRIAIYDEHTPIVTDIVPGVLSMRSTASAEPKDFTIFGGIAEINAHSIKILADDVSSTDELTEKGAELAINRANELLQKAKDKQSILEAERQLSFSNIKLQIARSKRRH